MAATFRHHSRPSFEGTVKNLKLDASAEIMDTNTDDSKDGSQSDATVDVKKSDVDHESLTTDQAAGYCGYLFPGYNGILGGPEEHAYFSGDWMEFQYPVMQADNGSLIYLMSGMHPGYSLYGPCLPVTMVCADGQHFNQPYPVSLMLQPPIASFGHIQTTLLMPSPYLSDPSVFNGDGTYGNDFRGMLEIPMSKPNLSSHNHSHSPRSKNTLSPQFGCSLEIKSSIPTHGMHNKLNPESRPKVLLVGYNPFAKFPSYSQWKDGVLYPSGPIKANARGWSNNEKPKARSEINNISHFGMLNEHNPRIINAKGSFIFGGNAAGSLATDGNGNSNSLTSLIRRDQYNLSDCQTKYEHAFFFVIKSYSEDDVHKSIKYNVWASTPGGNKKLDSAYQDAQGKMAEKGSICPVFLFFSVNASGQFCGVAEMTGRVDFNKNMDFWQQDKWNGYFPVRWHIIKDVPNSQLRHIILVNNENKPVTNSRDTQEVRFPQGTEMLNIIKNHVSITSILDDFDFYESRQKVMQEKRFRSLVPHLDLKQQKSDELINEVTKASEKAKE